MQNGIFRGCTVLAVAIFRDALKAEIKLSTGRAADRWIPLAVTRTACVLDRSNVPGDSVVLGHNRGGIPAQQQWHAGDRTLFVRNINGSVRCDFEVAV